MFQIDLALRIVLPMDLKKAAQMGQEDPFMLWRK